MQLVDKIHRISKIQGRNIIEYCYVVYNDNSLKFDCIIDYIKEYHDKNWTRQRKCLPSQVDIDNKNDYITYLLFDALVADKNRTNIRYLKDYKRLNAMPIQILTIAADMPIRQYGIHRRADIGSVCNSLGNIVLIPKSLKNEIDEFTRENGKPLPTELRDKVLANRFNENLPFTSQTLEEINNDTDCNRAFIENRYYEILNKLKINWIDPLL